MRSIFVIVSPDGDPTLSTYDSLRGSIEHVVTAPATLKWEPSDCRMAGDIEPLDSVAEEHSLAEFCRGHNIIFVRIPAG